MRAEFGRAGPDLLIETPSGTPFMVPAFFMTETPPALMVPDGAILNGDLVTALAGPLAPGQVAQLGLGAPIVQQDIGLGEPIGQVSEAEGQVTVIHPDGTEVILTTGGQVFQGDVLQTGAASNVSIVFVDDTVFSLDEDGRMVMDEMVYDPDTQTGAFSAEVVSGVFSFVSGQVAKTSPDGMVVNTPTATIGIRGSTVAGGNNTITLVRDVDGNVGEIIITNAAGSMTLNSAGASTTVFSANSAPTPVVIMSQAEIQQSYGKNLTKLVKVVAQKAQQDAEQAVNNAQQSKDEAAQADEEAQQAKADAAAADEAAAQADAEAQAANAEAEAAAAQAAAAQAEAEARGDEQAIAEAEAALAKASEAAAQAEAAQVQAEAQAQAAATAKAEAQFMAAEAEAKAFEADTALQQAQQAQQFSTLADTAFTSQAQQFQQFLQQNPALDPANDPNVDPNDPFAGKAGVAGTIGGEGGDVPIDGAPPEGGFFGGMEGGLFGGLEGGLFGGMEGGLLGGMEGGLLGGETFDDLYGELFDNLGGHHDDDTNSDSDANPDADIDVTEGDLDLRGVTTSDDHETIIEISTNGGTATLMLDNSTSFGSNNIIEFMSDAGTGIITSDNGMDLTNVTMMEVSEIIIDSGNDTAGATLTLGSQELPMGMTITGSGDDIIQLGGTELFLTDVTLSGISSIKGTTGNDTILAASGEDVIDGGSGDDIIDGDSGADTVTGGSGADIFLYQSLSNIGADTITDYNVADGDRIKIEMSVVGGGNTTIDANEWINLGSLDDDAAIQSAINNDSTHAAKSIFAVFNTGTGKAEVWYDVTGTTTDNDANKVAYLDDISETTINGYTNGAAMGIEFVDYATVIDGGRGPDSI